MIKNKKISYDRPASGQIFEYLRDSIISMELKPGQMIAETSLATQFGVSRTPVREALIKLSNIGFVEVLPQRGTYVTKFSTQKVLEARFIREALEVSVAADLASNVTDELLDTCQEIIDAQVQAAENNDAIGFQKLDDKFHFTLAAHTQYARVAELIEAEKAHMDRVRNLSLQETGQFKRVLAQHKAIIKAIKSGQADKAKEAMSIHMREVYKILTVIPDEHPEYFID